MPLSRFLAIALLVFPLMALGQSQQNDIVSLTPQTVTTAASEPWRILPSDASKVQSSTSQSPSHPSGTLTTSQQPQSILEDVPRTAPETNSVVLPGNNFVFSPGATILDGYCLKIRSYVVARDSKDSDSTHLVHYSTCQPASRYRLKTIELQAQPPSK
jgi:hypothetical protein